MTEVNIEKIVLSQMAQEIIETVPETERIKILEASLTETLNDVLKPWNVERVIKKDVENYMVEYLKKPEIQERIRSETQKQVDLLMKGVIEVIISSTQDHIKSTYRNIIDKKLINDVKISQM